MSDSHTRPGTVLGGTDQSAEDMYYGADIRGYSLASHGDVGEVGVIDVNAETGQMSISPQLVAEVSARAEGIATRFSDQTAG